MSKTKPATADTPQHLVHPIDLGQLYGMLAGLSQAKRLQRPEDQVQLGVFSAALSIAIDLRRLANYTTGEDLIDRSALAAMEAQAQAEAAKEAKPPKGAPAATTPIAKPPAPKRSGKKK